MRELSASERNQILGARDSGLSIGKVAAQFGRPKSTVQYTIEHRHDRVDGISQPRSGRPRRLSAGDKRLLKFAFQRNPQISYAQLIAENCPGVRKTQVYRFVKTLYIHKWKALERILLNQEDADRRYSWALEHSNWRAPEWRRVVWSDECSVEKGAGARQEWVFRRAGEGLRRDLVQPTPRGTRFSVMFWAAFSYGMRTDLVIVRGSRKCSRRLYSAIIRRDLKGAPSNDYE